MQIGSEWSGKDKNGNPHLSGEIDLVTSKIRIGIFKNTNKQEGSKQPDYRVVKLDDMPQQNDDSQGGYGGNTPF